jgi:hypothetical protein
MQTNTNIELLAISKAIATKSISEARKELRAGIYEVDTTVTIKGTVKIAEDTEKTPTVSIPMKEVLALFIARAGITRESSVEILKSVMSDVLKDGGKVAGELAQAADVDSAYNEVVAEMLTSLPKTQVKGAVTAKVEVTFA